MGCIARKSLPSAQIYHSGAAYKLAIIKEWRNLSQRFIDRSINEWRQRLENVVEKKGGTLNMFSDYLNTWQTAVHYKTIILI